MPRVVVAVLVAALCAAALAKSVPNGQHESPWRDGDQIPSSGSFRPITVVRAPRTEHQARQEEEDVDCTAIYRVELRREFTTQGNDLGMLPTHGKDTSVYRLNPEFTDENVNNNIGFDWVGHPFPNDVVKQTNAKELRSVTALTESPFYAFPLGYKQDVLRMHHSVCVEVTNVDGRWVEIMAQSAESDQQICVSDWRPADPNNPIQSTCGDGELYTCRDSSLAFSDSKSDTVDPNASRSGTMRFKFRCIENCDDETYAFFWRITASQETPICVNGNAFNPDGSRARGTSGACKKWAQPDGENWCGMRAGDDYPMSLLEPYPEQYDPPPVFDKSVNAAPQTVVSVALILLAALAALLI